MKLFTIYCFLDVIEKLAEAVRRFSALQGVIANAGVIRLQSLSNMPDENEGSKPTKKNIISKKKFQEMKFAVGEFYLSLVLIQNFQVYIYIVYKKPGINCLYHLLECF